MGAKARAADSGAGNSSPRFAIIGAGPSGLAAARSLSKRGIDFEGFEASDSVGGLWDIDNPRSTVYESAHLISSKGTTQFLEFPMPADTPDYPKHSHLKRYFSDYAKHFGLVEKFRFNSKATSVKPDAGEWLVSYSTPDGEHASRFTGVILANGTLAEPFFPSFKGEFSGELIHSSSYKSASVFDGKSVLIIGAGNSGCDIAVDAVHHAAHIDLSVRRGYYFVPKYVFGKPSDTIGGKRPLPRRIKQFVDSRLLSWFTGDPTRFGFPKPDYRIYESHPVVNSLILQHLGQGDLRIKPDIASFEGRTVHFSDGSSQEYDLVMLATGYKLDYPFIDREHLNWTGASPKIFLNIFGSDTGSAKFNGIYIAGMVEASGLGWEGRFAQTELLASYFAADSQARTRFEQRAAGKWPDLTGGYKYLALDRMAFYVNKFAYLKVVRRLTRELEKAANGHR
ncbi:MAG: NAD(P)-binding domain-containing protein [Cryobacterium sp.]|nr:NAD(P)-binding domain-containing protein [Cryobacterium sp.]MCO5293793.1 NAD(P)-binding domain-containing protein [Homoserinimonas sp.]MCW5944967.1 NAD(P)-binding domain-containing protein [Cryobacterium sp.]